MVMKGGDQMIEGALIGSALTWLWLNRHDISSRFGI